jgi:hypothetical protein
MTTVEDIEKAVAKLTPEQLAKFRAWFDEFDARLFDARIERDAKSGKLDGLAEDHSRSSEGSFARRISRAWSFGRLMKACPDARVGNRPFFR